MSIDAESNAFPDIRSVLVTLHERGGAALSSRPERHQVNREGRQADVPAVRRWRQLATNSRRADAVPATSAFTNTGHSMRTLKRKLVLQRLQTGR